MTTIAAGESWQTAYKNAAPGEVLTVGPGLHPAVQLDRVAGRTGDPVIFEFAPGAEAQSIMSGKSGGSVVTATGAERWGLSRAKVRGEISLRWGSDLIVMEDVDAGNIRVTSCKQVTVRRGDFGPFVDQVATVNSAGGAAPGVFDILFEDCWFHEYVISNAEKHAEGMQIWPGAASERVTLRRCRFTDCTDFDILVKAPSLSDLLIEDSVFDVPMPGDEATRDCYPNCGERWGSAIRLSTHTYPGAVIRNNVVKKPASITIDNKTGVTETGNQYVDELPPPSGGPPPDTQDPTVTVTQPADGAELKGIVTVAATAADNVGVTRVEFFLDGQLLGVATGAPYGVAFDTVAVPDGPHMIEARAKDAAGNSGSAQVTVTVANTTTPPPDTLPLTVLSETATEVTLGWTPVAGAVGYRFTKDGEVVSHTWDGGRSQVKFAKGGVLGVEALLPGPSGDWPV